MKDPTLAIRKAAAAFPQVAEGTSCNQTSYKAGKKAFLYIGPGAKGIGYKAMFKLDASIKEAEDLASLGHYQPLSIQPGEGLLTAISGR